MFDSIQLFRIWRERRILVYVFPKEEKKKKKKKKKKQKKKQVLIYE